MLEYTLRNMKFFFMNLRIILFFGGIGDIIILNKYVQKVTKLAKDEYVRLDVLVRVCCALGVDIGDIMEVTKDE